MIKRILVALDADLDTPQAVRCASGIAARHGATVTGLAVVDTDAITATSSGGGMGSIAFASELKNRLSDQARAVARDLTARFVGEMERAGLGHEMLLLEGPPFERIIEEMRVHDVLVMGRVPHFYYPTPRKRTATLAQIVKHVVAPTIVVGEGPVDVHQVLIGYDGSDASARTVQRFAQLKPFGTDLAVEVVHVRVGRGEEAQAASEQMVERMAAYLRAQGLGEVAASSIEGGKPDEVLAHQARELGADLIVAGAHSVSKVSRLVFGSTTHALIREGAFPLFVFH